MFLFFGQEVYGILALQTGIELTLPALEDEVLTAGPTPHPGKSLYSLFLNRENNQQYHFPYSSYSSVGKESAGNARATG